MRHVLRLLPAILVAACAVEVAPDMSGPSLTVVVSPLDLPGIDLACYDLLIENGQGQPVIARGDPGTRLDEGDGETLCSTRFGDGSGGSISYVAPCDASQASHAVTLWVDGLYSGTMAAPVLLDYEDPCPGGCVLSAACAENADTPVTFNLTIMRPASQGFFDVAVNFDSVFCSAKLDCEAEGGGPLKLLHDPTSGERSSTVVVGLACTAGPGGEGTVLLRDPIRVSCGGVDWDLDPAIAEGNAYSAGSPAPAGSPVWQYAVYAGREDLPCGAESCEKVYWNVAIGMELTTPSCTLTTTATAGSPTSLPGASTPEATRWPLITWEVDLTSEGGTRTCSRHPLNGEPEGVGTDYTSLEELRIFDFRFDGTPFGEGISGQSCFTILQQNPGATDGVYVIDPDGPGGVEPFEVYCDMSTDGGGWTLLATLSGTTTHSQSHWGVWSDDWWTIEHGDPLDASVAFSNHDFRKFRDLVGSSTILRASSPNNVTAPTRRYHFGFTQDDWDHWNAGRNIGSVNVVGPFNIANVLVSTSLTLSGAVQARSNGHWYDGTFFLGTSPGGGESDGEGLAGRYQVGSNSTGNCGFVANVRSCMTWNLWLR